MTHSYPHMMRINELAAKLEKELKDYRAGIEREISYAAYCEEGMETQYWELRGYDGESARDKARDELDRAHFENGYETPFDDELKIIDSALKALDALKIAEG